LVQRPSGAAPIEEIGLGERVVTLLRDQRPSGVETAASRPVVSDVRRIHLSLAKPCGGRVAIELLRSLDWIEDYGAHVGGSVFLDMPEMGVEGLAEVLAIEPCPPLEEGEGRLVTGTFKHTSGPVYDLKLESESKSIGVTATHPFWSVDREAWVSAIDLEIGETLKTLAGTTVVENRSKREEPETVYNIEVEGDHVYRVGESGVLVHNASAGKVFLEALENCCGMKSTVSLPKCGSGAKGPLSDTGELADAFKKEGLCLPPQNGSNSGVGLRRAWLRKVKGWRSCCWQDCRTDIRMLCVSAPRQVRLPPQTLRFTTAGRRACSAR